MLEFQENGYFALIEIYFQPVLTVNYYMLTVTLFTLLKFPIDYKVACESDPFCSCSTPDPRQNCKCNVLNKSIQECDSATLTPVTTEGGRNSTPVPTAEGGNS